MVKKIKCIIRFIPMRPSDDGPDKKINLENPKYYKVIVKEAKRKNFFETTGKKKLRITEILEEDITNDITEVEKETKKFTQKVKVKGEDGKEKEEEKELQTEIIKKLEFNGKTYNLFEKSIYQLHMNHLNGKRNDHEVYSKKKYENPQDEPLENIYLPGQENEAIFVDRIFFLKGTLDWKEIGKYSFNAEEEGGKPELTLAGESSTYGMLAGVYQAAEAEAEELETAAATATASIKVPGERRPVATRSAMSNADDAARADEQNNIGGRRRRKSRKKKKTSTKKRRKSKKSKRRKSRKRRRRNRSRRR